jgi:succinylglutamic semialdehyde dehydrogenase
MNDESNATSFARRALNGWSATPIAQREEIARRFAERVQAHRDQMVRTICLETGKPKWEANTEVDSIIAKVAISIEAKAARRGESSKHEAGATASVRYKPWGVVVVLGPFNFPGHLPNGHIVPALLAGNVVVFKPSELTQATGFLMLQCWKEAGLPEHVLEIVQGGRETGEALVDDPGIDAVFFTGSYAAGRAISRRLADRPGVICALEMGGNNPLIVHGVENLDAAAYLTIQSAFISAGQRCSCARRLIVPEGNDAFIDRLVAMMAGIRVGSFNMEPEPFMGRVINDAAAERLLAAQRDLVQRGGKMIVEMKPVEGEALAMLRPGLIDVTDVRDRADEELFGPILQLVRVKDFDAAIAESNDTAYGLAAGLFCDDRTLYERFFWASRAGVVNWNRALTGASSRLPFGGVGRSGNGRPSAYFAADYCDYAVGSIEVEKVEIPGKVVPGIML